MTVFAVSIFLFLASEDGFSFTWKADDAGVLRAPSGIKGLLSAIAFVIGAATSVVCGYLGMASTFEGGRRVGEDGSGTRGILMAAIGFRPFDIVGMGGRGGWGR